MKSLYRIFAFLLLLCVSITVFAWGAPGHMIITQIAYDQLDSKTRAIVDQIVPDMKIEDTSYKHYDDFENMAHWPDDIKAENIKIHGPLHFKDTYFSTDGTPLPTTTDPENVVWAIQQEEIPLADSSINPYDRARTLAFFIHFVGDAHQPLHCASRVTKEHPGGDQGGNLFAISYTEPSGYQVKTLHALWDGAVDLYVEKGFSSYPIALTQIQKLASEVDSDYPASSFGKKVCDLDPNDWIKESFKLAKQDAYQIPECTSSHCPPPSAQYLESNSKIAEQRLALAGYRLANLLKKYLSNEKCVY